MQTELQQVAAPGRVNLIGEHIDYHGLPVLPMALRKCVRVRFARRADAIIRAVSEGVVSPPAAKSAGATGSNAGCNTASNFESNEGSNFRSSTGNNFGSNTAGNFASSAVSNFGSSSGNNTASETENNRSNAGGNFEPREFEWRATLERAPAGDWSNYLRAAALAVAGKWGVGHGIDAHISSDLPAAAGLSSSSALLVAFALALLRANGRAARFEELMEVLPDGEQFVGTRGGGMDHAASLASRAGHASLIHFRPVRVTLIPVPADWAFLVVDSGVKAEKSGAVRDRYNFIRDHPDPRHVPAEAERVLQAAEAMRRDDATVFGRLMLASHASLRDNLQVSHPELDCIVGAAVAAGALGARLTGAGFGGSAVVLSRRDAAPVVREALAARWPVIDAEPGDGALAAGA